MDMGVFKERLINWMGKKLSYPLNRRRLLFFAMPKCASSSVYQLARKYGFEVHDHNLRSESFVELYDRPDVESRFVFTVLRNPVSRAYSAWRYLSSGGGNRHDAADSLRIIKQGEDFDSFVKRSFHMSDPELLRQIHFRPMVDWVIHPNGSNALNLSFPLEQIEFVADQFVPGFLGVPPKQVSLRQENRSQIKSDGQIPLSNEGLMLLQKVYRADFEFYNSICGK